MGRSACVWRHRAPRNPAQGQAAARPAGPGAPTRGRPCCCSTASWARRRTGRPRRRGWRRGLLRVLRPVRALRAAARTTCQPRSRCWRAGRRSPVAAAAAGGASRSISLAMAGRAWSPPARVRAWDAPTARTSAGRRAEHRVSSPSHPGVLASSALLGVLRNRQDTAWCSCQYVSCCVPPQGPILRSQDVSTLALPGGKSPAVRVLTP